jgi:hypothetical protein
MTRLTLFLIFTTFLVKVNGQTYVPMPMQNCYWQMSHTKFCSQSTGTPATSSSIYDYKIYPNSDTIIATIKYIKFYSQVIYNTVSPFCSIAISATNGYWGAVRQDTAGKKIYIIYPSQANENLLYNLNYIKGDTVKTSLGFYASPPPSNISYRIVDSVYYQSYTDGICRKTFRQKLYQFNAGTYIWTQHNYFTEGIGNEVGLNVRDYLITTSTINSASQEQWSSFLTINNFTISAAVTNTCAQNVGIKTNYDNNDLKIFPNPAHNDITVSLTNPNLQNYYIVIFDLIGNEILKSYSKTIKVDQLSSGIYIIKCFSTDSKDIVVSKFIKD